VSTRERGTIEAAPTLEQAFQRASRGDRGAFGAVVSQTSGRLFRLAARITGDPGEAEDALQDAYLRAFDALAAGRFDGRSEAYTWLYRIVANASLDALRARRRRRTRLGDEPTDAEAAAPAVDDAGRLAARAALRELDAWLAELPDDQRAALVLKEIEGLSSNEVAEIMKCSVGAVEQRLVRARATLRRRSGERDEQA
jgi:RNA polymerase sigma-70 factor (ECF subfamily)